MKCIVVEREPPGCDMRSSRWLGRLSLFVAAMAVAIVPAPLVRGAGSGNAPVYILVIDHSTSMKLPPHETDENGNEITKWRYMTNLAATFVETAPLNAKISIYIFAGYENDADRSLPEVLQLTTHHRVLTTAEERAATAAYIAEYPEPADGRGTALNDSLAVAFEQAAKESRDNAGQYIRVMVYSDGKDEHSRADRFKDSTKLLAKYKGLVEENDNTYLFFTPLGKKPLQPPFQHPHVGIGSPLHPIPVCLNPDRIVLRNPANQPQQELNLEIDVSPLHVPLLQGKQVQVRFESDQVRVEPLTPISLKPGPVTLSLNVTNAPSLSLEQEYSGSLKFIFPKLDRHEIQSTPPDGIPIRFQKGEKLELKVTRPMPDAVFVVNSPAQFVAETLQNATVTWSVLRGSEPVLPAPDAGLKSTIGKGFPEGEYQLVVNATVPGLIAADPVTIPFRVIDIGMKIVSTDGVVIAGVPTKFTCQLTGPIEGVEWKVSGEPWALRGDAENGVQLEHTFRNVGAAGVYVIAKCPPHGTFYSKELPIDVKAQPSLSIEQPAAGSRYKYAAIQGEMNFATKLVGREGIESLDFVFRRGDTDGKVKVLDEITNVPFNSDLAPLVHEFFEEQTLDRPVEFVATAKLKPGYEKVPAPTASMILQPPNFHADIITPPKDFGLRDEITFKVTSPSHTVIGATWNLGDGTILRGTEVKHRYQRHAPKGKPYTVSVKVSTISRSGVDNAWMTSQKDLALEQRPPKVDYHLLNNESRQTQRFHFGTVSTIVAAGSGDLAIKPEGTPKIEYEVDGGTWDGGDTIAWDRVGRGSVTAKWWHADGDLGGPPTFTSTPLSVRVIQYRHVLFLLFMVPTLAVLLVVLYWCRNNRPCGWLVWVSDEPENFTRTNKKVRKYWSRRRKEARIDMHEIMKNRPSKGKYWTSGEGKKSQLIVGEVARSQGARGALRFSDYGNPAVNFEALPGATSTKRVYELLDDRAPEDDPNRHVYFQLEERDEFLVGDTITLVVAFLAAFILILWVTNEAYLVNMY